MIHIMLKYTDLHARRADSRHFIYTAWQFLSFRRVR